MKLGDKKRVILEAQIKDDERLYINFNRFKGDDIVEKYDLLSIMVSSLVMIIKMVCEDLDYEKQGKLIGDVIDTIKQDTFDVDSFKDLKVHD